MEYRGLSLSSPVYDDITKMIENTYKNACVLYVDEIMNKSLLGKYNERKRFLEELRGEGNITEMKLFHGTKIDCINSIASNGFKKEFNITSAYGKGTYFSTKASYSCNYTNKDETDISYMFVCDVLVGKCTNVNGPRDIDTNLYDNSVNNLTLPDIYVTPYDDGAYPRYLVGFHKNAK
jgi:Poly(ADP-ribose) polymerase catalytic domain